MSITIFGIVWICGLIYCFIQNSAVYIIGITIFSMVFQSASALLYMGQGIGPQIITCVAMIMWNLLHSQVLTTHTITVGGKNNKNRRIIFIFFMLFFSVIVLSNWLNLGDVEIPKSWLVLFLQLVIYVLCFFSMWNVRKKISFAHIEKIIEFVGTFVLIVGVLQFLITTNKLSRNIIWETFIYTKDCNSAYYWYEYYPRLFSTFMEPSYCGAFLVGFFFFNIILNKSSKYNRVLSIVCVFEILLTMSSTAYGALAIGGLAYLFFSRNKKALKYLVPIGFVSLLFLLTMGNVRNVLNEVIFMKAKSGSAITRNFMNLDALDMYKKSPWIGVGYKCVRGSNIFASGLGQVGILGMIAFGIILVVLFVSLYKRKEQVICSAAAISMVSVVSALFIAIPDFDNITLWQILFIVALVIDRKSSSRGEVDNV